MLRFRTLGTVDLRDAQGREPLAALRRPKLVALLGYLAAARPGGFHRRDMLLALLWPELDTGHARNALRQSIYELRAALGRDVLVARGDEELAVDERLLWCDARALTAALEAGDSEGALALYGGDFLGALHLSEVPEFERWLDEERAHLRRRACETARALVERGVARESWTDSVQWAHRWTELAPFDENAVQGLLRALEAAGDRAGALRAYDAFERRLAAELEVEPSPETQQLVQRIRARRPPIRAAAPREGDTAARQTAVVDPATALALSPLVATHDGAPGVDGSTAAPALQADRPAQWRRTRRGRLVAFFVAAAGLLAAGVLLNSAPTRAHSADPSTSAKRIAVLPFANLGAAEDVYFADGMADEVAARLQSVDRFRVIGSASADRYRGTTKAPAEIGRELGVDYLLVASVRWEKPAVGPQRVRVTPHLVSAADGAELWADVYDEPLDEIFRVQSEIATRVVAHLDLALLPPERRRVADIPTHNLEAYDFYLRGKQYLGGGGANVPMAARMFEQALSRDSNYVQAYSELSRMYTRLYWSYEDHTKDRLARAKRFADKAIALAPDLPDSHLALAVYYGLGVGDYERSMREYALASSGGANPQFLNGRGTIKFRQGRFREAIADFDRTRLADPGNPTLFNSNGWVYDHLREYERAEALFIRSGELAPEYAGAYVALMWLYLERDGNTRMARAALRQAEQAGVAGNRMVLDRRAWMEIFDRRYGPALALLDSLPPRTMFAEQTRIVPTYQLKAMIHGLTGHRGRARAYFDSCLAALEPMAKKDPDDPRLHSALGVAYAGLGRKQDAIREGLAAVEMMPVQRDVVKGYNHEWELARIYTMVGEHERAIAMLEHLLEIPGYLTAAWLRMDPTWDPLRRYPRFQKLTGGGHVVSSGSAGAPVRAPTPVGAGRHHRRDSG